MDNAAMVREMEIRFGKHTPAPAPARHIVVLPLARPVAPRLGEGQCCALAVVIPCVCRASYHCPTHGAVCVGSHVDFGVLKKMYEGEDDTDGDTPLLDGVQPKPEKKHRVRYKGAEKVKVFGDPNMKDVSTSLIERSNLTTRTWQRRFTRRALTFSKSLRHHVAAVALHYAWYNLGHVHSSLRQTPAMALGVEDHVWSVAELLDAALNAPEPPPLDVSNGPGSAQLALDFRKPQQHARPALTMIKGGL